MNILNNQINNVRCEEDVLDLIERLKDKPKEYLTKDTLFDKIALIDADYIPYIVAYKTSNIFDAYLEVQTIIQNIVNRTESSHYILFHTTKCNFRNNLTDNYKDNRKDIVKSDYYYEVRNMMLTIWQSSAFKCYEADDLVTMVHRKLGIHRSIIVSPDKDLLQTYPSVVFRPNKNIIVEVNTPLGTLESITKERIDVNGKVKKKTKVTGHGTMFLFWQSLVGDVADNIKGVNRIGSSKAYKLLHNCKTIKELYDVVLKCYEEAKVKDDNGVYSLQYPNPTKGLAEQLSLLYMVRRDPTFKIPKPIN